MIRNHFIIWSVDLSICLVITRWYFIAKSLHILVHDLIMMCWLYKTISGHWFLFNWQRSKVFSRNPVLSPQTRCIAEVCHVGLVWTAIYHTGPFSKPHCHHLQELSWACSQTAIIAEYTSRLLTFTHRWRMLGRSQAPHLKIHHSQPIVSHSFLIAYGLQNSKSV